MVSAMRAPLFVPATRPDRFSRAAASAADAIILDLEDAVTAADKNQARANLKTDFTDKPVLVRINGTGTLWYQQDVEALRALWPAAVMLPKTEKLDDINALATEFGGELPVVPLIETARGFAAVRDLAGHESVVRLAFGSIDYCADLGCAHTREILLPVRSELVLASKLAGIAPPIDGVTARLNDAQDAFDDAVHARDLGMTGKLCIHPNQTEAVHRAFIPTTDETDWANRVLAAGPGAVMVDGAMVDEPVRLCAQAILKSAVEPGK